MNKFRKYAQYIILSVLLGMLIISFALWGVGDMLRMGGNTTEVAHVGGTHVPVYGWVGGTSVSVTALVEGTVLISARRSSGGVSLPPVRTMRPLESTCTTSGTM